MSYSTGMYLYSVLSDSVIYMDSDRFILVFTGDYGHIQNLLDNLPMIVKHLETFAYVRVIAIFLYYFDKLQHNILWINPRLRTMTILGNETD